MRISTFEVDFKFRDYISVAEVLTGYAPFLRSVNLANVRGGTSDWLRIYAVINGNKTKQKAIRNLAINDDETASVQEKALKTELVLPETLIPGRYQGMLCILFDGGEKTLAFDFEVLSPSWIPTDYAHAAYLAAWIPSHNPLLRSFAADRFSESNEEQPITCMYKIFQALAERHLVYHQVPTLIHQDFQSFYGFDYILSYGGSCADLSLLFASLLWQHGCYPALLLYGEHMTVGCFSDSVTHFTGVIEDKDVICQLISSRKLSLIEITDLCSQKNYSFEQSAIHALDDLKSASSCCLISPLTLLRNGSVHAFPDAYHEQALVCPHCGFDQIHSQTNTGQITCPACNNTFSIIQEKAVKQSTPTNVFYDPRIICFGMTEYGYGVTHCQDRAIHSVRIPSRHENHTVSCIGANAFTRCQIKEIILPDEIATIADQAFYDCVQLTSIMLPDNLSRIGSGAFSASGLKTIRIPEHISHIPVLAFANCRDLENITLEEGIESIDERAFCHCPKLKQVYIPRSVKTVSKNAFDQDCQILFASDNTKLI